MNVFLRKEARLLLPFWGIAMVLAIVPSFAVPAERYIDGVREIIFWTFGFGMVLLGMAPFGHEFSLGTFSFLLAQPAQRSRIWRIKTLLVAIAGLLTFAAFALSLYVRVHGEIEEAWQTDLSRSVGLLVARHQITPVQAAAMHYGVDPFWHAFGIGALLLVVGISGGFWTTLLFRQTGAALWFAILIPGLLIVVVQGFSHVVFGGEPPNAIWAAVLILYSGAGLVWARRMFAKAQDSQWLGETVALFSLTSARAQVDDASVPRRKGALRSLVRKELASHQISFLIAFGLLVLHICTLVFRGVFNPPRNSEFRLALEAVPLLWLLIPWLMGCVAIAEERKLGTMESQLCLPVNRRLQFAIKFAVVLSLGTLIGGLIPYLIESLGHLAGVFSEIVRSTSSPGGPSYFATLVELLIGAALIALVSLFASSLTRNTLHALGAAIVFAVGWVVVVGLVAVQYDGYAIWRGPLILVIGIPVAAIATIALSFSNYKTLHAGGRVWLRTFAVLFVALFCTGIATAVIYQRPGELVRSVEPQHGGRQLSGPVQPVVRTAANRLFALLPDGRIWAATDYHPKVVGQVTSWSAQEEKDVTTDVQLSTPSSGTFVGDGNWVEMAASGNVADVVALRADGSLWDLFPRETSTNGSRRGKWMSLSPNPQRIGLDHDWKTVAFGGWAFYGIKTNGTLWSWDFYTVFTSREVHMVDPVQFGTNSDWSKFLTERSGVLMMKTNGDLWGWRDIRGTAVFERTGGNGSSGQSVSGGMFDDLVIHQDGTLWARSWSFPRHVFGSKIPADPSGAQFRVGNDSDWLQISGDNPDLFALKKDGRLVKSGTELFSSVLGRPSQYSDWIAIGTEVMEWDQRIALAADGTLCSWVDEHTWGGPNVFFAPTRRPVWTLNILTDSKN